jgi:hypothetical protein
MKLFWTSFLLLSICLSVAFAEGVDEYNNRFKLVGKEEGEQTLYVDINTITRNKNITHVYMINRLIKGGKLYNAYKSKYPALEPSFCISDMTFDCSKIRTKVTELQLYDDKQNMIDTFKLNGRWNQLRIKSAIDNNFYNILCK